MDAKQPFLLRFVRSRTKCSSLKKIFGFITGCRLLFLDIRVSSCTFHNINLLNPFWSSINGGKWLLKIHFFFKKFHSKKWKKPWVSWISRKIYWLKFKQDSFWCCGNFNHLFSRLKKMKISTFFSSRKLVFNHVFFLCFIQNQSFLHQKKKLIFNKNSSSFSLIEKNLKDPSFSKSGRRKLL